MLQMKFLRVHFACVLLSAGTRLLAGQVAATSASQTSPPAAFDVASIRPNNTNSGSVSVNTSNTTFAATNVSLLDLVSNAYDIRRDLISGMPDWSGSARFDVMGKIVDADAGPPKKMTSAQQDAMLQALLASRFHLKAHIESKQLPVYDLLLAKGGPKFQAAVHPAAGDDAFHGVHLGGTSINNGHFTAHGITLDSLCRSIAGALQRTVIDRTNLPGTYDIDFTFAMDFGNGTAADATDPPLPVALQQQLGLKLESAKGPVDTLVIDHAERPTEN